MLCTVLPETLGADFSIGKIQENNFVSTPKINKLHSWSISSICKNYHLPPLSSRALVSYDLNWSAGEPNNEGGRQNCLAVHKLNGPFKFDDTHAFGLHEDKFVCESKPKNYQIDIRNNF